MKNTTIGIFVLALIFLSAAFLFVYSERVVFITGFSTSGTSSASFNMTEEVSILVTGSIDFGSGRVDVDASNAVLDSSFGLYNFSFFNANVATPNVSAGGFGMAFDSDREVTVLYGGLLTLFPQTRSNQTYEFDHNTRTWSLISSADIDPSPGERSNMGLVYDTKEQAVILFGGVTTNYGTVNDTWKYDGTSWTNLSPSTEPIARNKHLMVFDNLRNVTVIYGGDKPGTGSLNDTWEYDAELNTWTQVPTASNPGAFDTGTTGVSMVFDSKEGKVLLFNGSALWDYDGSDWNIKSSDISADGGPSWLGGLLGYDSVRNKTLAALGEYADNCYMEFWEYDYSSNRWFEILDFPTDYFVWIGGVSYSTNNQELLALSQGIGCPDGHAANETWILNYTPSGLVSNGSWDFYKDYFFLENDGTVNISINYTADKNAADFIGGSSPSFMIKGVVSEPGACDDLNTTYAEVPGSAETPNLLCPLLNFANDADEFWVATKIVVPSDISAGEKTSTITFTASKV